jgi:hypothetical protein
MVFPSSESVAFVATVEVPSLRTMPESLTVVLSTALFNLTVIVLRLIART